MPLKSIAMLEFLHQYEHEYLVLAWVSFALFLVSLAVIPLIVVQLPTNYFQLNRRNRISTRSKHPLLAKFLISIKNISGFILLMLGILMLVFPGQGILTILIGISMMNFPGKYKLERKLVLIPKVLTSLNWIRSKANKDPLIM